MENEAGAVVNDDVQQLLVELDRLAEGGDSVKFGTLFQDERCEQIFEAIVGTLKAAKKRGLIDFEGEMLLQGSHDDVDIKIIQATTTDEKEPAAEESPSPEKATEAEEPAPEEVEPETSTEAPESPPKAPEEPEPAAEQAEEDEVACPPVPAPVEPPSPPSKDADEAEVPKRPSRSTPTPISNEKDSDGKWKSVETSYIDYRTADPNRLEARRSTGGEAAESGVTGATTKDADGKWKVDTGYINYRTKEVENLGARKMSGNADPGSVVEKSQRTQDGKWKVDTSYIDYRTGDTANMTRKQEEENKVEYDDPASSKVPYAELQGAGVKPPGVDPAKKEQYLSESEFQTVFGISMDEFAKMAKWKQNNKKKEKGLF